MREPCTDDLVRLTRDLPELSLSRGELGVVRSIWFAPNAAFEVEFGRNEHLTRVLLLPDQVEIEESMTSPGQMSAG
jgi:uncharacterized protein DUF4926